MFPVLLQLRTVLAFATVVCAVWFVGRRCLPCLVTARSTEVFCADRRSRFVWEFAIGLLAWGSLLTVFGLVGLLYRQGIVAATLLAALGGVVQLRLALRSRATELVTTLEDRRGGAFGAMPGWLGVLLAGGAVLALATSFVSALAPPLAGDALCYHLELPKRFLADHRLTFFSDDDNSTFPLLTEMWFLWGLAIDGPAGAQLMHWLTGAVLAGAGYVLALPLLGRTWSLAAAALVLITPGINNQMTAPLNDVALALFTTLALAAWLRIARDDGSGSWTMLGLMVGGATAVKYTGLVFAAVLGLIVAVRIVRVGDATRASWIRGACLAAILVAVTAGPWYVRAAYHRGDPLFPFLSAEPTEGAPSKFPETKTPLGRGLGALVEAPWMMTMSPERFGGRAHQLGPLFLMLVPCVLLISNRRELRPLLLAALLYGACCVILRQNVRFLFPLVSIFAVVAAAVLRDIAHWDSGPRRIAWGTCAVMLLFLMFIPVARVRPAAAVAMGLESREAFLARREPTFVAADWMNRNLPDDARVLSQEQRAFYFDSKLTRENIYRRNSGYHRSASGTSEPPEKRLKAEGFTHLFLAEKSTGDGYDAALSTLAEEAMAERPETGPVALREWRGEVDGETRRYRLLLLR
jgi:hypothetical protein